MARRGEPKSQLALFEAPREAPAKAATPLGGDALEPVEPCARPEDVALAARLPPWIRFGTSSWTFPGWAGLVYAGTPTKEQLVATGLGAYARHPLLRTVGIDRSYYAPLTAPELAAYAAQLPAGFQAVSKVWDQLTTAVFPVHPRFGERAGKPNPYFLHPDTFFEQVLAPYEQAFAAHAGPFVVEIPPIPRGAPVSEAGILRRLDAFLRAVPRTFRYAVELRNRELLTARYLDVLRAHGAGHVLNYWSYMPALRAQLAVPGVLTAPFVVVRLLLPPGTQYEAQRERFAPFRELADPQLAMREDVRRIAEAVAVRGGELFVLVNNKAEGSSPLTVRALAELLVR